MLGSKIMTCHAERAFAANASRSIPMIKPISMEAIGPFDSSSNRQATGLVAQDDKHEAPSLMQSALRRYQTRQAGLRTMGASGLHLYAF